MPLITTEAVVLQTHAYSETSKILRLLTRTHGVRAVIAKGAMRPRSRYGGVLEPFSTGVATFYAKEGRDLHTLSGFDLTHTGQALGRDLLRFGAASLLAEIVLRTASEEADPSLHGRVRDALRQVETAPPADLEATGLAEAWTLIACLGFGPALDVCLGCDRTLDRGEETSFDYAAGGVRCRDCIPPGGGRTLPAHARQDLVRLVRGEPVVLQRTAAHWALLTRFLDFHVADGMPFRSLAFLNDTLLERECAT